jgi:pseudouridine-5'-phosphate glycosidase
MKNPNLTISPEIARALNFGTPVVALESTVITHGLPQPQNLELARDMEQQVRDNDATPATVALLDGEIRIGLSDEELIRLSESDSVLKVSHRDFAKWRHHRRWDNVCGAISWDQSLRHRRNRRRA